MKWAIKHKSGRTLFVTSDEFIANNRRKMGWIVEEIECDHEWVSSGGWPYIHYTCMWCDEYGWSVNLEGDDEDLENDE